MASTKLLTTLFATITATRLVQAYNVEFFYSDTYDTCQFKGQSMPANGQTSHGGVCAYVPSTQRIYACPAPDPTCWTWNQNCKLGNQAGTDQILCNAEGTTWCCASGETCTTAENQINVCISNFTSPNSGVDVATANKTEFQALGVSNVTATSQTVDPTPFSTRNVGGSAKTSAAASSTTSQSASPTGASSSSKTSSGSLNVTADTSSGGLSGGAIAGIVIGVIAGLAVVGVAFFLLGRRRRRARGMNANQEYNAVAGGQSAYGASLSKGGPMSQYGSEAGMSAAYSTNKGYYAPTSEIGDQSPVRAEMGETDRRFTQVPSRHELSG